MNKQLTKKIEKFWDDRPCNIRHSKKPVGEKEYFNEVEAKKYFVEPHIPIFAEFEKWTGLDVLEIGCGIGTDSINFVRNGANLDIVELSGESLNICKQRFSVFDLNASFYKNNAEVLTTFLPKDKKYDLVYSFGVIHHASDPEEGHHCLAEEACKPGVLQPVHLTQLSQRWPRSSQCGGVLGC